MTTKRPGRGPGKKPRLVITSIRIPKYVLEFYRREHPDAMQAQMRAVLTAYADDMLALIGESGNTPPPGQVPPDAAPGDAPRTENA